MRDPARIPEMCELLRRAWERVPDMRLGQLVVNALRPQRPCPEIFHAEESELRKGLERLLRQGAPEPELPPCRDVSPEWKLLGPPTPATVHLERARVGSFQVEAWYCQVLELRFVGHYREGSQGTPDAEAMVESVITLLTRTWPDVVLLDLTALRYVWGDGLLRVFETIGLFDVDQPVGAVVLAGEDSEPGLRSLGLIVHTDSEAALEEAKTQALRRTVDIG
jgi:hypothetical protein